MSLVGAALSVAILMMRGWLARYPDLPARSPFAAIASWARQGVCPYGIAIGLGALATLPARFY